MIRRWSHINTINFNLINFNFFFKNSKLVFFKNNVNLKRMAIGVSKFKRKVISKWKRRASWFPYFNLFKSWAIDYFFFKNFVKFQFANNILNFSFLIYNFEYLKTHSLPSLGNSYNFIYINFLKSRFKYFFKYNFFLKNYNALYAFIDTSSKLSSAKQFADFYLIKNNQLYLTKSRNIESFNLSKIIDFFFANLIQNYAEIHKILILLFFYKISKR